MITFKKYQDWKKIKKEAELLQMRNCKRMAEINYSCPRKEK